MWAYDGWEDLNLVGSEVANPHRNFPLALVGGVSFVAVIYLLFSAACLKVFPFQAVAASQHIASDVVEHVIGRGAAAWITVAMAISALGSMNSSVLSGARVNYAMARDGIFFKIAGGIHPKFRTPGRALIFQGVLASLMALTGTFEELTNLFIFAGWIFYGCGGGGLVPHAAHRAGFAAALSLLGLPMGAGNFCGGGAGADGEYLDSAAGTVDHRVVADSGRTSFLQNVGSATKIWRGSYRVTAVGLHITRKALAASSLATISG